MEVEEPELKEEQLPEDEDEAEDDSEAEASDGEEEEEDEEDEGSESDAESSEAKPRRTTKPFKPPPPRDMPNRTTRGQRMGHLVQEVQDDEADDQFWNQEFFAEEAADEVYLTESEPEDRFDADFLESEEEEESEDEEAERDAREAKRKTLKPPGYKAKPAPKPKPKPKPTPTAGEGAGPSQPTASPASTGKLKRRASVDLEALAAAERRSVRDSTRIKVAEAEEERRLQEAIKVRRAPRPAARERPALTQAELLAEAARTEIENTKSLQLLVAIEEETRRKAHVAKTKYVGPLVRFKSRKAGEEEQTTLEVRNMPTPPELQPRTAPPPPAQPVCAVTGLPARYRDPLTKLPYATLEAYRRIKAQYHPQPPQYSQASPQPCLPQQLAQQQLLPQQYLQLPAAVPTAVQPAPTGGA